MRCSLVRWLVSKREDTGKPLASWAGRHLERCSSCREFDRFVSSLAARGAAAAESGPDPALDKKIRTAWEPGSQRKPVRPSRRIPVPAPALAGLLALAAAGVVWLTAPGRTSLPGLSALIDQQRVSAVRTEILSVEAPLRSEKEGIERSLDSAVKFLIERLDPGLGD